MKEWLLTLSLAGIVVTSLYRHALPSLSPSELQVLFILFVLFVAVQGLRASGLIASVSRRVEQGRWIAPKLVVTTFFLSMLVTNDVALVVMVPVTLMLSVGGKDKLVILEALAANAGSALTPFGNPQNLFIYWYYGVPPGKFMLAMAPFSGVFLLILGLAALAIERGGTRAAAVEPVDVHRSAYLFLALLLAALLIVLHLLPVGAGIAVVAGALTVNRASLRIDYPLLVTFLCFFGISENLKGMFTPAQAYTAHTFLISAVSSQFISNVPAALLFAKFTLQWKALAWGTNAGGFGSLIGSLANLIAYRVYLTHNGSADVAGFTVKFLVVNFIAFFISVALYFLVAAHI